MRTTVDLPDELFRQIKARAAMAGVSLKDYFTTALQDSLYRRSTPSEIREPETQYGEDVLVLSDDCVLPLIAGEAGEEMRGISGERIAEILEDEDVEDAIRSR